MEETSKTPCPQENAVTPEPQNQKPSKPERFTARFIRKGEEVSILGRRKDREIKMKVPATPDILSDMRGQEIAYFKVDLQKFPDGSFELTILKPTRARSW